MKWELHHVNLQAFDIQKSVRFYREILQFEGSSAHTIGKGTATLPIDPSNHAVIGEDNAGIHLYVPAPDFALKAGFSINPTIHGHTAFRVKDIDGLKKRLEAAGILYAEGRGYAIPGLRQVYFYDPAMNCIEVNQIDE